MLLPSIFGDNLFDNFMDDMFPVVDRKPVKTMPTIMRTDIKETEDHYELAVELPGFKKEDVKIHLKDGYLNISASTESNDEENDGKYLRRERRLPRWSRQQGLRVRSPEGEGTSLRNIRVPRDKEDGKSSGIREEIIKDQQCLGS